MVKLVYRQHCLSPHSSSILQNSKLLCDRMPQRISGSLFGGDPREVISHSQSLEIHSLGHARTANHFSNGVSRSDKSSAAKSTMSVSVVTPLVHAFIPRLRRRVFIAEPDARHRP